MQVSTRGMWAVVVSSLILGSAAMADEPSMAAPKPSPEHEMLAKDAGVWDAEMKTFMGGPDAPPMVSKGVETVTVLPGGLWVLSEFKGEFAGAPFHGRGQTGFNPKKKKFIGTWVDSMGPGLSTYEGTYDAKTRTMTMTGEVEDQATGKMMKEKMVTEYKGDDTHVFTMYIGIEESKGAEMKVMEITYKKRK